MSDEIKGQINNLKTEVKRVIETETRKTTDVFYDIKSYFERLKEDLKGLNYRLVEVREGLKELKNDIKEIKSDIRNIEDKVNK